MNQLPLNWVTASINDIAEYISRGKSPKYTEHSTLPIVNQRAVRWFGIEDRYLKYIHPDQIKEWAEERFIRDGDILLNSTGRGTIGRACLVLPEHLVPPKVVDSHVTIIRSFKETVDPRYLFAWIRSPYIQDNLESLATGATNQIELSRTTIAEIELPLAPLNEQIRIADKLDTLISRINTCQSRLEHVQQFLERFRQSVLAAATSGRLTEDWRDERGISIDDWDIKTGLDVFPFITSGSRGWAKYYSDSGSIFVRVGNLDHNTINLDLSNVQYVALPSDVEGTRTRVQTGDILISITADIGMIAYLREDIGEAYINQHICLARQTGEYNGEFLAYYLASPIGGLGQFTKMQRGATKAGLTLGDIGRVKIRIPTTEEQVEIVRRINMLLAYAEKLETRYKSVIAQVEQLSPSILAKAFRGELVKQDSNDEPASLLLERIKARRLTQSEEEKVVPKFVEFVEKVIMTQDTVKEFILSSYKREFSFDELKENFPSDYEELKDILFSLLEEPNPIIHQVFDESAKAIRFVRRSK